MSVVKNRALSLATRGMLGGSLLAIATHGLLQVPEAVAPPIELPPPVAVGGGGSSGQYVDYVEAPRRYAFTSRFQLLVDPHSLVRLSHQPPPVKVVQLLRGHFISRDWTLHLSAASTATHFDAQQDEDDLILLAAIRWLQSDDEDGGYFS